MEYYIADPSDHMWQQALQAAFAGSHKPAWVDLHMAEQVDLHMAALFGSHMAAIAEPYMAALIFEPCNSPPQDSPLKQARNRLKQARNRLKEPRQAFAATFEWGRENRIIHIAPTLLWRFRPPTIKCIFGKVSYQTPFQGNVPNRSTR